MLSYGGALTEDSVEPIDPDAQLENLEDWERHLHSDPKVAHKLRSLDRATSDETRIDSGNQGGLWACQKRGFLNGR